MSDYLSGVDLNDLDSTFGGNSAAPVATSAPKLDGVDLEDLDKSFGDSKGLRRVYITKSDDNKPSDVSTAVANPSIASGIWQGLKDIPNSGAQLIGYLDDKLDKGLNLADITTGGSKRNAYVNSRIAAENEALPTDNTAFDVGRTTGQVLATAPLMPASAFRAVAGAAKAIPYVGKLAGLVANGGLAGGIFGAATNSTNDDGLASNAGTNAAYGAAAGPVAEAGMQVAGKAITGAQNIIRSVKTNNILKGSGIDPNAAKNTLARLTDAGYTPDQAHAELRQMGQSATLADLDPSLTTEAGGLAAKGGVPTSTLKSRFGERASGGDSAAHDIMETNLGVKPDYEVEKEAAKVDRSQKTSADYNRAKSSSMALDVMPIARSIKDKLDLAVGSEAKELHEAGAYLFDSKGNIKTDTAPLLKVRQALDDRLSKLKTEGSSAATSTYRAVSEVRDQLDKVLKTNPDLATADAKYAKLRQDFEGINIGKDAFKKNYSNFEREFNNASPEKQEFMRKGLRIQVGDLMEKATRGELSEAQRLLGKSSSNRSIVKLAFGQNGEDVLDALAKEAKFRSAERTVSLNSATAERQAVQARPEYGGSPHEGHYLTPIAQGAALDLVTGTPGAATLTGAGKGAIQAIKDKLNAEKVKNTIEGTADLLSRQSQHGQDTALDFLDRISQVRSGNNIKLPIDNSKRIGPASTAVIPTTKRVKRKLSDLIGVN